MSAAQLAQFREHIASEVRAALGLNATEDVAPPEVRIVADEPKTGYRVQTLRFVGATGVEWPASLAIPEGEGKKPAILLLSPDPPSDDDLGQLAKAGNIVFALQLPPGAKDAEGMKSPLPGPFYMATLRAFLVGKTLVGIRVEDVLRAVQWLSKQTEVDPTQLSAQGTGPMGIVLLHAAVLDPRIASITLDRTLVSYRNAVEEPVTRDLAQSVIPGVLRHYDLDDLVMAIAPRTVVVTDPIDAAGKSVDAGGFRRQYAWVFAADRKLHQADQLRIVEQPAPATKP
jgi:cephalosporin-C deacetylase-like acetyl esterase